MLKFSRSFDRFFFYNLGIYLEKKREFRFFYSFYSRLLRSLEVCDFCYMKLSRIQSNNEIATFLPMAVKKRFWARSSKTSSKAFLDSLHHLIMYFY